MGVAACGSGNKWEWQHVGVAACGSGNMWEWQQVGHKGLMNTVILLFQ